jgi:hypothetical protein
VKNCLRRLGATPQEQDQLPNVARPKMVRPASPVWSDLVGFTLIRPDLACRAEVLTEAGRIVSPSGSDFGFVFFTKRNVNAGILGSFRNLNVQRPFPLNLD